jgi:hypothetical protein
VHGDTPSVDAEFARYEAFLRQELPSSIRQELETRVDKVLENMEEDLKSQLPGIFRDMQIRLFQNYLQRRASQSIPPFSVSSQQTQIIDTTNVAPTMMSNSTDPRDQLTVHNPGSFVTWENVVPNFNGTLFEMTPNDIVSLDLEGSMMLPPIAYEGFLSRHANTPSATTSLHQDSWDATEHHGGDFVA